MSDIDLDAAILAARQRAADVTNDGTATRLRIRETLARRPDRRVRRTTIITALIATIFGSTAFAYYAGWRPPWSPREPAAPAVASSEQRAVETASRRTRAVTPAEALAPPAEAEAITPPVEAATITAPVEAPIAAPVEAIAPPVEAPIAPAVRAPLAAVATAPSSPSPAPARPRDPVRAGNVEPPLPPPVFEPAPLPAESAVPPPPPPATPDPELAAYRVAHEAHFRGRDAAAALRAWDGYLAAFPSGKLSVDARYSRALILIKLERWTDAASALRPFADAPAGSYRQAEAARLLAALPR